MATGMIGKKNIIGPISGQMNNTVHLIYYKSLETSTASVVIDNESAERTISANVKKTPGTLTITDKSDEAIETKQFDGSKDTTIILRHYDIEKVSTIGGKTVYKLRKDKETYMGDPIEIPDGKNLEKVELLKDTENEPYLKFTFQGTTEFITCSLKELGITNIWAAIDAETAAINSKVTTTNTASKVYGTDASGNQTTYNVDSFGQVDDVQVKLNDTFESVVENKVAKVDVSSKANDNTVVHLVGDETITGIKTFPGLTSTSSLIVNSGYQSMITGTYNNTDAYILEAIDSDTSAGWHIDADTSSAESGAEYDLTLPAKSGTFAITDDITSPGIVDYDTRLPAVTPANKDSLARLDGDEVYSAKYVPIPDAECLVKTTDTRQYSTKETAQTCIDSTYVEIATNPTYVYGYGSYISTITPFKIGVAKNLGKLEFNIVDSTKTTIVIVRDWYNSTTQSATGSKVSINGTEYTLISEVEEPESGKFLIKRTLIELPAGISSVILEGVEPESGETKDNRRVFLFEGIIQKSTGHNKSWKQLARKEDLDTEVSARESGDAALATRTTALETKTAPLTDTARIIHDISELPEASASQLTEIYRCNDKLYQCIKTGEGRIDEYSFTGVTGTAQVTTNNWATFAALVTDDFKDKWTANYESVTTSQVQGLATYSYYKVPVTSNEFAIFDEEEVECFKLFDYKATTILGAEGNPVSKITVPLANLDSLEVGSSITINTIDEETHYELSGTDAYIFIKTQGQEASRWATEHSTYYATQYEVSETTAYNNLQVWRNAGQVKLGGSSSASTDKHGVFAIQRHENETTFTNYPVTKVEVYCHPWSSSGNYKTARIHLTASDNTGYSYTSPSQLFTATDATPVKITFDGLNIAPDIMTIIGLRRYGEFKIITELYEYEESGETHYTDTRILIDKIKVTYGDIAYSWKEIGAGADLGSSYIEIDSIIMKAEGNPAHTIVTITTKPISKEIENLVRTTSLVRLRLMDYRGIYGHYDKFGSRGSFYDYQAPDYYIKIPQQQINEYLRFKLLEVKPEHLKQINNTDSYKIVYKYDITKAVKDKLEYINEVTEDTYTYGCDVLGGNPLWYKNEIGTPMEYHNLPGMHNFHNYGIRSMYMWDSLGLLVANVRGSPILVGAYNKVSPFYITAISKSGTYGLKNLSERMSVDRANHSNIQLFYSKKYWRGRYETPSETSGTVWCLRRRFFENPSWTKDYLIPMNILSGHGFGNAGYGHGAKKTIRHLIKFNFGILKPDYEDQETFMWQKLYHSYPKMLVNKYYEYPEMYAPYSTSADPYQDNVYTGKYNFLIKSWLQETDK